MNTLKEFISYRLKNHSKHIVFWMYFFVIVCGVGGAGIWANFFQALVKWDMSLIVAGNVASSMYTFFPALTISCLTNIILPEKVSRPVRMAALMLLVFSFFWMVLCAATPVITSIICGCIGCIVSLFVWIIDHGDDPQLSDDPEISQNALGGSEDKPVTGGEGDFVL